MEGILEHRWLKMNAEDFDVSSDTSEGFNTLYIRGIDSSGVSLLVAQCFVGMGPKQSKVAADAGRSTPPPRPRGREDSSRGGGARGQHTPQRDAPECRYFLAGCCRYGDACRFSHGHDGAPQLPAPVAPASQTPPPAPGASPAAPQAPVSPQAPSPKTPKIRSEEQAILMAMLNSLKDSLHHAQTTDERRAIYAEMRKAAELFKAEQERIRSERRQRASSQKGSSEDREGPAAAASPLRGVQFPIFPYDSDRFGANREGGSEDRTECAICICSYEEMEEVMVLPCLHWFHARCGQQWLEKSSECPLCQFDVAQSLREGVQVEGLRLM